ncbi:MAG TPA: transcriptional repressor [Thermomicrobiales bacterium]|nr:transcriptional repressor [Thermomicrobiales bacterium]
MTDEHGVERTLQILQDAGYRLTGPRRAVVDEIQRADRSFTADDLLQRLTDSQSGVGRATVFRTLDLLVQNGVLDRLHQPDGCHSYLLCGVIDRHHHHLICSDCGAVIEFEDCSVQPLLEELGRRTNFQINGHWLEVFGQCSVCRM